MGTKLESKPSGLGSSLNIKKDALLKVKNKQKKWSNSNTFFK